MTWQFIGQEAEHDHVTYTHKMAVADGTLFRVMAYTRGSNTKVEAMTVTFVPDVLMEFEEEFENEN